jgi:AcrR family transcriptional regulator
VSGGAEDLRRWRLPRGRHGLPREIVERSQRERLMAAVVRVTTAKGYKATTVADVLEEAGVGRESFYELFADKRECMLAAHAILMDDLESRIRAAYLKPGAWEDRVTDALAAALEWFAADPAASRFTLVELAAAGPVSRERFRDEFGRFVALLDEGLDGAPPPQLPQAGELAVSATLARVYEEVARERTGALASLLPELTFELLVPYVGEDGAREQQRRAASIAASTPRADR